MSRSVRFAVTTTHEVSVGATEVVKRFRSSSRGEAEREWNTLCLLDEHVAGLAPRPIRRAVEGGRPVIVMTRVAGEPLGGEVLRDEQMAALADAWTALHSAPAKAEGVRIPARLWAAGDAVALLREQVGQSAPVDQGVEVVAALAAGRRWVWSSDADRLAGEAPDSALGHGDGNLANVLWDGERCRLVDFEDSGLSDRAYEYADLIEHISGWSTGVLDAGSLLGHLALEPALARRTHQARRLMALYWLIMLLPGNPADRRNPPGTLSRQALRLSDLLS